MRVLPTEAPATKSRGASFRGTRPSAARESHFARGAPRPARPGNAPPAGTICSIRFCPHVGFPPPTAGLDSPPRPSSNSMCPAVGAPGLVFDARASAVVRGPSAAFFGATRISRRVSLLGGQSAPSSRNTPPVFVPALCVLVWCGLLRRDLFRDLVCGKGLRSPATSGQPTRPSLRNPRFPHLRAIARACA